MASPAPPMTAERFVEIVRKSQLVGEEKLEKLLAKIRDVSDGQLPDSPKRLARVFEKRGLITNWHIEKLLAGKYRGFFIGRYKLLGHIGTGGMSSVYLAEHTRMGDRRAIKVLPKARVADATYLARFQLEAKAIASLSHPNIVSAYDIDNEGDVHFIVMEYVDGLDLQQLVRRDGPLDFSNASNIIAQAARGLQHAHDKGVIHRDIKPGNLLVDEKGIVRLLDMGLALVSASEGESLTVANNENVLGTADYLAPEQALNSHTVDHRADIYGLGCTMYFLLTGSPPFSDGTLAQRIARHQTEMPRPIRDLRSGCPGEIDGIVVKMIQKDPAYRYQNAGDVAERLERYVAAVPVGHRITAGLGARPERPSSGGDSSSLGSALENLRGDQSSVAKQPSVSGAKQESSTIADARRGIVNSGLGSGDSGRLVSVSRMTPMDTDSFLDLQAESGYRPNSKAGRPAALIKTDNRSSLATGGSSSVHIGAESDIYGSSSRRGRGNSSAAKRSSKGLGTNIFVWILAATVFFVVAASLGFVLARLTTPS